MDTTILKIQGLSKQYGNFNAVSGLDLEVFKGEIFALLGPNGAGKTTTIRMIMGILQPTGGTASVDGLDCFSDRAGVMERVGYVPDDPFFYDYLKGREIIRFVGDMHGMKRNEIENNSRDLIQRLDLGDALEEYVVNYSKGMKKKLAVLCALLHEPMFFILDEPTNGLDPFATRSVHELINERVETGSSVFFSTHLLDQAEKLCSRVGILNEGRLVAVGKTDELKSGLASDSTLEEIFFSVMKKTGGQSKEGAEKGEQHKQENGQQHKQENGEEDQPGDNPAENVKDAGE